jgi:hypothetical protein
MLPACNTTIITYEQTCTFTKHASGARIAMGALLTRETSNRSRAARERQQGSSNIRCPFVKISKVMRLRICTCIPHIKSGKTLHETRFHISSAVIPYHHMTEYEDRLLWLLTFSRLCGCLIVGITCAKAKRRSLYRYFEPAIQNRDLLVMQSRHASTLAAWLAECRTWGSSMRGMDDGW